MTATSAAPPCSNPMAYLVVLAGVCAAKGCGFLMVSIPAPGQIKRLVAPAHLSRMLSVWSCYLPTGTAIILLGGSWGLALVVILVGGWQWTWVVTASCAALGVLLAWQIGMACARRESMA